MQGKDKEISQMSLFFSFHVDLEEHSHPVALGLGQAQDPVQPLRGLSREGAPFQGQGHVQGPASPAAAQLPV